MIETKTLQNNIYNENNIIIENTPDEYFDGVITDPFFETMSIGNSKATTQDIKSNFIELCKIIFPKLKNNSNLIFFCTVDWLIG